VIREHTGGSSSTRAPVERPLEPAPKTRWNDDERRADDRHAALLYHDGKVREQRLREKQEAEDAAERERPKLKTLSRAEQEAALDRQYESARGMEERKQRLAAEEDERERSMQKAVHKKTLTKAEQEAAFSRIAADAEAKKLREREREKAHVRADTRPTIHDGKPKMSKEQAEQRHKQAQEYVRWRGFLLLLLPVLVMLGCAAATPATRLRSRRRATPLLLHYYCCS